MGQLSTLQKRVLSAAIAGPVTLLIIISGGWPFLALIAAGTVISLFEFVQMERKDPHFLRNMPFWVVYTLLCSYAFIQLRLEFPLGLFFVLALMLMVWACDIGAYFTGKTIGGPKMAPILSPNKTWAGLMGGMVCSGLVLMGFDMMKDVFSANPMTVFLTGWILGAVGQAGDLLISSIKRRVGVKDTGHILPGHGGLLDRIDALLLVTPVFLIACKAWLI